MANYEESTNIKLDWAMPFMRTGKFPLDRSSMFSSYDDAVKYAKGDTSDPDSRGLCGSSYIGQQICVYENDEVKLYIIDHDRTLKTANSDNIMWVTFTEDASKTLTADKSIAEIWEAYSNCVMVYATLSNQGSRFVMPLVGASESQIAFETMVNNGVAYIIGKNNKWQYGHFVIQSVENKTTSITSSSTDIQYPSAKAVYDSIQDSLLFIKFTFKGYQGRPLFTADKTYDEVESAIKTGKTIIINFDGSDSACIPSCDCDDTKISIYMPSADQLRYICCYKTDGINWKLFEEPIEMKRNKVISIDKNSSDDLYPSAKAVYGYIDSLTRTTVYAASDNDHIPSVLATYNYGQSIKTLDLTNTTSNQIVSIATVDDNGAPKSYTTLDIASDDDVNTMITEVLGSYSTQQQPSSIILNSNTADSTKQFELTIDDTGTLTSQEL